MYLNFILYVACLWMFLLKVATKFVKTVNFRKSSIQDGPSTRWALFLEAPIYRMILPRFLPVQKEIPIILGPPLPGLQDGVPFTCQSAMERVRSGASSVFGCFCFGGEVVVKKSKGDGIITLRIQSYSQMIIGDD